MKATTDQGCITYRAMSGSAWVGELVYVLGVGLSLAIVVPLAPVVFALIVPIPLAVWLSARVCVVLCDDGSVMIRNFRSHRVPLVAFAVVMQTGPRGAKQVNFVDRSGVETPAFAMTLWGGRGRAAKRCLQTLGEWVARCDRNGVTVSLDESERGREASRIDRVRRGLAMSTPDPVEALRTVRRASIADELISIRSAGVGFFVSVESIETRVAIETEIYPTFDAALARGIEEVTRRRDSLD